MARDSERSDRIQQAMRETGIDLLACALPINVLLLTGYWPVVGTSVAVVARNGPTLLLVPEDEHDLASRGWADTIFDFRPGSLTEVTNAVEALQAPLQQAAARLRAGRGTIAYEAGSALEPSSYAALHIYGESLRQLLRQSFAPAQAVPGDEMLRRLRAVKTPNEIERIRMACRVAQAAFERGAAALGPGLSEAEAAHQFQGPLSTEGLRSPNTARAGGFVFCMSGPNSADAGAAYARTRCRPLEAGDLVLIHCNSYLDGHWTDITRTYALRPANAWQEATIAAVLAARAAALPAIRPGVRAAQVDQAARSVLAERGFGQQFTHSTGHGVGFAAIDHTARPRLHPRSDDVLEEGMVFNVEPALYFPGRGGCRHCDMVALTSSGPELLTPFQTTAAELAVPGSVAISGAGV